MSDAPFAPGSIIAGKYRVERVLGTGAMGMVLGAINIGLGSRVAIKVRLGGRMHDAQLEERFFREARVAARLRSEHAAKVLDLGLTETGAPYIVMEYLDGQDLESLLEARGPLPIAEAVAYILEACEAIAEAHALGIVHRDIKPANLFRTTGVHGAPCIKLVDFGVAKEHGGLGLTRTTAVLGSPLYMSPEHMAASRDVDGRADIWSLGVTLYQLLTETTPFPAETMMALCAAVANGAPVPIEQHRADVPPGLAAVIMQCFEKDRTRRWPNVASLAAALAPYAPPQYVMYVGRIAGVQGAEVIPARPTTELAMSARTPPAMAAPVLAASVGGPPRKAKSTLKLVAVAAAVLLPAAGLAVGLSLMRPRSSSSVAPPVAVASSAVVPLVPASAEVPVAPVSASVTPSPPPPAVSSSAPPATPSRARPRTTAAAPSRPSAPPLPAGGVLGGSRQ